MLHRSAHHTRDPGPDEDRTLAAQLPTIYQDRMADEPTLLLVALHGLKVLWQSQLLTFGQQPLSCGTMKVRVASAARSSHGDRRGGQTHPRFLYLLMRFLLKGANE